MELRSLQQKNVRVNIKNGWNLEDFCEKYRCTEDELKTRLDQIFKNKKAMRNCIDKIEKNSGKHKSKPKTVKASVISEANELETLRREEATLSKGVMKLETEWEAQKAEHLERLKSLRDKKAELKEFRSQISKERKMTEKIIQQDNRIVEKMNDLTKRRNTLVATLEEKRARIEELKKLTLCVFDGGEITTYDGSDVKLDDTGHEEIYAKLTEHELCDELRMRDVKTLARLLAMSNNSTIEVEIICDRKELEEIFETLKRKG